MGCNKAKKAFISDKKIYTDESKKIEITDAKSDLSGDGEGKGLVVSDEENTPYFFQTDQNKNFIELCEALIDAFSITSAPTSAWETEANTKFAIAKNKLESIKDKTP